MDIIILIADPSAHIVTVVLILHVAERGARENHDADCDDHAKNKTPEAADSPVLLKQPDRPHADSCDQQCDQAHLGLFGIAALMNRHHDDPLSEDGEGI